MREISGVLNEPLVVEGEVALTGVANKPITVTRGSRLVLSGIANDDVLVEAGAEVEASGIVNGTIRQLAPSS